MSSNKGNLDEALARALAAVAEGPWKDEPENIGQRMAASRLNVWAARVAKAAPVRAARKPFDLQRTDAVVAVERWLDAGCTTDIVLRGPVGTGKTTAAVAAVTRWCSTERLSDYELSSKMFEELVDSRMNVVWLTPDQLVSSVLHDYDERSIRLRKYVVIDDMGRETKSDFAEALCALLDREGHTLLITTNLTKQQMRDRYDLRLLDRLNDRAIAVDLKGASLRRQDGGF